MAKAPKGPKREGGYPPKTAGKEAVSKRMTAIRLKRARASRTPAWK